MRFSAVLILLLPTAVLAQGKTIEDLKLEACDALSAAYVESVFGFISQDQSRKHSKNLWLKSTNPDLADHARKESKVAEAQANSEMQRLYMIPRIKSDLKCR